MTMTPNQVPLTAQEPLTTRIKICGVSTPEAIQVAAEAGANGIGFVRAKGSSRYIDYEQASALLKHVPDGLTSVAVYVNAPLEEVMALKANAIQLHGQEDEIMIESIKANMPETFVIRGFPFSRPHLNRWQETPGIHAVLVDGQSAGSGRGFDYEPLMNIRHTMTHPLIVAGGLTPDNVGDAITLLQPWAVDVSSGVESAPGVKDHGAIRAFCQAVREADQIRTSN